MSATDRIRSKSAIALAVALGLGLAMSAWADRKPVVLKNAPVAVQKTIAEQLNGGTLTKLFVEVAGGTTTYEAELMVGGVKRKLTIDPSGKMLEAEMPAKPTATPEATKAKAEPAPEAAKAKPTPKAAKAKPTPKATKAKPTPEATKAKPTPEAGSGAIAKVEEVHADAPSSKASTRGTGKAVLLKNAPGAVQKTIAEQLKGGALRKLSVTVAGGQTTYEAELTVGGAKRNLTIDPSGKVLEAELPLELSAVPEAARAGLTREAGAAAIAKVEEVIHAGVSSYKASIKEAGKKDRTVVVSADGTLVAEKK
ncbi:MAG: hypothetical protein JJE39_15670 [Vicinamibacteria bacterium]|nr:hypothetical protein [Vicinamibacteria bacterium]